MNFKQRSIVVATVGAIAFGFGFNAKADTTDDLLNALIAKGVLTEEEGQLLQKGRDIENDNKKKAVTAKQKDGLILESGDGNFSVQLTGRVHADYRAFDYDEGEKNAAPTGTGNSIANTTTTGADTFDIRRARIGFKAKYKEFYEAELNADLASGSNTSVTNTTWDVAYFNVAWWKPVQFRFGQFKMPMNLEELTSSNNIDFMERSYVNQLSPAKELGAMVHGIPFTGTSYALAISNGVGKNAETDIREDGKDVVGRVTANFAEMGATPNKEAVYHVGASFSQGDQFQGAVSPNGRSEARGATFFRSATLANPAIGASKSIDRSRVALEGAFAYNQFKVQGEWLQQNNDFKTATRSYDLDTDAWYAEALWTITGEKYADSYKNGVFGGIKPKVDFDPATFSGGAWELGIRYSKFDASDYDTAGIGQGVGADAAITTKAAGFAEASAWVAGVKFLPNSNTRLMLNYVDTNFDNPIGGPTGGIIINNKREDSEKALIMRAQWMF
jgi:phosphate-selective porin OprO and OprP